jgi:nucleoside-diphosphate-sugar epimerase
MKIAILGATSEIAKDLILSISAHDDHELMLFARRPEEVSRWLTVVNLSNKYMAYGFESFDHIANFDAILNFVGSGDPAKTKDMGASIIEITEKYDYLALNYLKLHPECKYIFMSSGAAYGENFDQPAGENTQSLTSINKIDLDNFYSAAKILTELRHRLLLEFNIIDVRIFSYFSHTQALSSRFFMADLMRSIVDKSMLLVSKDEMVRDYLNPTDFYALIKCLLHSPPMNIALDCFTVAPVGKWQLLEAMETEFSLKYEVSDLGDSSGKPTTKMNYYSLNRDAKRYGYSPKLTSIDGIRSEILAYLYR